MRISPILQKDEKMAAATGYPALLEKHLFPYDVRVMEVCVHTPDWENGFFNLQCSIYKQEPIRYVSSRQARAVDRHARITEPFIVEADKYFYVEISTVQQAGRFILFVEYEPLRKPQPKRRFW